MRLDHIAYRVKDRTKTAEFFQSAFGYRVQQPFTIDFGDGQFAQCIALEPPEKPEFPVSWVHEFVRMPAWGTLDDIRKVPYHLAPEVFISDGTPDSIVGQWVAERGGIGGIHHLAYQVPNVAATMQEWKSRGLAEFSSEEPIRCPEDGLVQVFTRPMELMGGVILEFIERTGAGFCKGSVKALMESTRSL